MSENVSIVVDDAFEFVLKTKEKYDLIIIDIFQDTTMPNFLFENFFTKKLCSLLEVNGCILFNTMILNSIDEQRNSKYSSEFYQPNFRIKKIPRIENHNELLIIEKIK